MGELIVSEPTNSESTGDERKLGEVTPKNRGNAGKGRPKGSSNKLTKTIRESIEIAFHEVGGPEYLVKMAIEQPVAFMALLAKVMPTQVEAKIDMQPGYIFRIETVIADGERNQLEAD